MTTSPVPERIYVARFAPSGADTCHVVLREHTTHGDVDVRVVRRSDRTSVLQQLALHKKMGEAVFLPSVDWMEQGRVERAAVETQLRELAGLSRKELLIGSSQGMDGMTLTGEIHEDGMDLVFQAWTPLNGLALHQRFFRVLHGLASSVAQREDVQGALRVTGALL